nr:uncharacterized protein CI109_005845 [Kwoniella shandongensis]KAA5525822.1 hypothetical protein CI109_005845 [Kwoniella shandongensis]
MSGTNNDTNSNRSNDQRSPTSPSGHSTLTDNTQTRTDAWDRTAASTGSKAMEVVAYSFSKKDTLKQSTSPTAGSSSAPSQGRRESPERRPTGVIPSTSPSTRTDAGRSDSDWGGATFQGRRQ